MTKNNKEKALKNFDNNPEIKVIFITLKAGNVGLNLTIANNVFIVDPW